MTDRQTDGRNCDSICALSIYAVARKKEQKISWHSFFETRCSDEQEDDDDDDLRPSHLDLSINQSINQLRQDSMLRYTLHYPSKTVSECH